MVSLSEILKYIKRFLRWWWLIVLCVTMAVAGTYLYTKRQPVIYAAASSVMIGPDLIEDPNPDLRQIPTIISLAENYANMAKRTKIAEAVVKKLDLEMTAGQLQAMINAQVIHSAQLVQIIIFDEHPKRAKVLADAVAEELVAQSPSGLAEAREQEIFIQDQLDYLKAKINELKEELAIQQARLETESTATGLEDARKQITFLQGELLKYQNTFIEFVKESQDTSLNRVQVFEYASVPTTPIEPSMSKNLVIGTVVSGLLALVAIVLLEFFDVTLIWERGESESMWGLPVLGAMGKIPVDKKKLLAQDKLWAPEIDALRNIYGNILLTAIGREIKTLLVTSPSQEEGKSFLAANLAATVATPNVTSAITEMTGAKVILIDANLRNPALHEIFDMPNLMGLTDILTQSDDAAEMMLHQALRPTSINNLLLLTAGRTQLNPASLLNTLKFPKLIEYLKEQADFIVVDSAPILEAVETKAMVTATDGTFLVIVDGRTRSRKAQKALEYFQGTHSENLLGFVFNRVSLPDYQATYAYKLKLRELETPDIQQTALGKLWPFQEAVPSNSNLLTMREVAERLGIKSDLAKRWCQEGRIKAVKKGRNWFVKMGDLDEFVGMYEYRDFTDTSELLKTLVNVDKKRSTSTNGKQRDEIEIDFESDDINIDDLVIR